MGKKSKKPENTGLFNIFTNRLHAPSRASCSTQPSLPTPNYPKKIPHFIFKLPTSKKITLSPVKSPKINSKTLIK